MSLNYPAHIDQPDVGAATALAAGSLVTSVRRAFDDLRAGRPVVVVDAHDREAEGDVVVAAQFASADTVNFMAKYARGLICLCLPEERCDELELPPMTAQNTAAHGTAFTITVDARFGITSGVSVHDRARTIAVASDPAAQPADLVRPGHIFPLRARSMGVLERAGHTEAGVDLMRLAGLTPAAVICEVMDDDGTMARGARLSAFSAKHGLQMLSTADLVGYRRRVEESLALLDRVSLSTQIGEVEATIFKDRMSGAQYLAAQRGDLRGAQDVPLYVRPTCINEMYAPGACGCAREFRRALWRVGSEPRYVLISYNGFADSVAQVRSRRPTACAAERPDYVEIAQILRALGVASVRLVDSSDDALSGLGECGIRVSQWDRSCDGHASSSRILRGGSRRNGPLQSRHTEMECLYGGGAGWDVV